MRNKINILHFLTTLNEESWLYKLHVYLNKTKKFNSKIVCMKNKTNNKKVYEINKKNKIIRRKYEAFIEKILFYKTKKVPFSSGFFGIDITQMDEIETLIEMNDILFIHWINGNFLSLNDIKLMNNLNKKKLIWRFYDSWPFTGGCHVRMGCENYLHGCVNCPYFKFKKMINLPNKIYKKKHSLFSEEKFNIIVPSNYIRDKAAKSFFSYDDIKVINNGVKTIFTKNKEGLKNKYNLSNKKKYILFGATDINLSYKGLKYLKKAIQNLNFKPQNVEIITFGKKSKEFKNIKYNIHNMGYINSRQKLMEIYRLSDVFVGPSLEESFGNVFLESISAGLPCVIFENTGAATDIIEHKYNGYIARYKDYNDLRKGIEYILNSNKNFCDNCYNTVKDKFLLNYILNEYITYFKKILQY